MQAAVIILFGAVVTVTAVFVAVILGALIGASVGWIVGLVFPGTLALLAEALGIPGAAAWQLGVILGFVGGFLKTNVTSTSN